MQEQPTEEQPGPLRGLRVIDAGTMIAQFLLVRGGYVHLALFALPLLALISLQSGRFDRKLAELEK